MNSFMTCQDIQIALFNYLDEASFGEKVSLDEEVKEHVLHCAFCDRYQREWSFLMNRLKSSTVEIKSGTMKNTENLSDKVWEKLLAETDLGSLSAAVEPASVRFLTQPSRSKAWWAQPVAPMAAAAVLVVMAGFSYTQFGNFSNLLGTQTVYISPDYELDGQKLVYDSADQILDPTWIDDSDNAETIYSELSHSPVRVLNQDSIKQTQTASASALLMDSNSDPLQPLVGF